MSFLGTGEYVKCIYYFNGEKSPIVKYVQEATVRLFCKDWNDNDKIFIFLTEDARKNNWEDNEKNNYTGLKKRLKNLQINPSVEGISIPYGKNEKEIWEIFDIIFSNLENEDRVVFDITHSFRSIPMLAIVVLNYAKILKNIDISGIYYGAFEVLGPPDKVKNIPYEERIAPIFNLTPFDLLLDWGIAVNSFIKGGNSNLLRDLAKKSLNKRLRESKGKDVKARNLSMLADAFGNFTNVVTTCRGPEISNSASKIKNLLNEPLDISIIPAFKPLIDMLKEEFRYFIGDSISDGIRAAEWCYRHNLIQQAYTLLREVLISYFVKEMELDKYNNFEDIEKRDLASSIVNILSKKKGKRSFNPKYEKIAIEIIDSYKGQWDELLKINQILTLLRNDMNHAGYGRK